MIGRSLVDRGLGCGERERLDADKALDRPAGQDSVGVTRDADRILSGWPVERFIGVKSFPLAATETSIYQRPPDHPE